jgi:hypothetical protein
MFQPIDTGLILNTAQAASRDVFGADLITTPRGKFVHTARMPIQVGEGEAYPQLYLFNKNDGGHALRISVGFYRVVCMNGLIAGEGGGFNERVIHRAGQRLDEFLGTLDERIRVAMNDALYGFDGFKDELQSLVLTEAQGFDIIGSLPMSEAARRKSIYFWAQNASRRPEDRGYTAWQLYNLVNEFDRRFSKSGDAILARESTRFQDIQLLTAVPEAA